MWHVSNVPSGKVGHVCDVPSTVWHARNAPHVGADPRAAHKERSRSEFQRNTYAMMLLARFIDKDMAEDSPAYRLLRFYIKTHFNLSDEITPEKYIEAIIGKDVATLIKGILSYIPMRAYRVPDYGEVAAALISA